MMKNAEKQRSFDALMKSIATLQARVRGVMTRIKTREIRIAKQHAIQVIQNFARRGLALIEYKRRYRAWLLREVKKELRELDAMRIVEAELRYFYFHEKVI
jgi:hypothetical protein